MEKVLNITGRIEDRKRQKQIESNRDKFDAVQRMLQCGTCRFKCAMCGRHAEREASSKAQEVPPSEFSLCESCQAEFEDFVKITEKKGIPHDIFWHNREWVDLWSSWVTFQRSLNRFRNSLNLRQLPDTSKD